MVSCLPLLPGVTWGEAPEAGRRGISSEALTQGDAAEKVFELRFL